MTARRPGAERHPVRWERQRAWGASIFTVGLLLFVWPFVRTPALSLGHTYAHLLGAWALVVVALLLMARGLAPRGPHRPHDG